MKIITISDTHGKHDLLKLPEADIIIHAGDITPMGKESEVLSFLNWFSSLKIKYKVFIAGNHDFYFEKSSSEDIHNIIPENIIYLNDQKVTIEGINIWGSPITPWFYDWAFNRERGADIRKHWDLIPNETDIIVTHGPSFKVLDSTVHGQNVGCEELSNAINRIKPKFHICGHIHEAYGIEILDEITFINSSVLNEKYRLANEPISFDF